MPASANIVLADGLASPANHTFAPAKNMADYALFEDRAVGIYVGYNKLVYQLTRPNASSKAPSKNLVLTIKVETPKLETLGTAASGFTPAPSVAYRPFAEMRFVFPERCVLQDRKDLLAFAKNALANATFSTPAVESYELAY